MTTTFKKKVYMNKKGEPGKRQQRRVDAAAKRPKHERPRASGAEHLFGTGRAMPALGAV